MDDQTFRTGIQPDGTRLPHGEGIRGPSSRRRLPNRRETLTERVEIALRPGAPGQVYLVSVGPVPGPVREIFAKGPKGDAGAMIDDGLILASVMLQAGFRLSDLIRYCELGDNGEPASLIGRILAKAVEMEGGLVR